MDPRRVNIYSAGAGIIHTDVGAAIYQLFMAHSSPSLRWPPVTADARLRTTYRCRCGRLFDTRLGRKECPDVYFAGNQPAFATSLLEGSGGQKVGAGKQKNVNFCCCCCCCFRSSPLLPAQVLSGFALSGLLAKPFGTQRE